MWWPCANGVDAQVRRDGPVVTEVVDETEKRLKILLCLRGGESRT